MGAACQRLLELCDELSREVVSRAGPDILVARCKKKMEAPFIIKIEEVKLAIGYNKQAVNR